TAAYAGVTLGGTQYVLQPTSPASNINTWVYWVLTRQGGTLTLYRNAVQIAQRTDLPATASANINGYIADELGGLYYLTGGVDDVAVYSGALNPQDITSHYKDAGFGPAPAATAASACRSESAIPPPRPASLSATRRTGALMAVTGRDRSPDRRRQIPGSRWPGCRWRCRTSRRVSGGVGRGSTSPARHSYRSP